MTAALIPTPVMQFLDADGNPLVGGKLYTYAAGTSTPLATYTDYGGATPNANPVILNSRGEASIWFGTAAYKLELYTAATVLIWTADNVSASTPVVYGTGVAAALAINVGTAGSILVNGGALVGTTLSASGTSTMAAINASGNISVNSSNIVLTAATGAISAVGALTLAPVSANPQIFLNDVTKGSAYLQGGVNTGGTGAGDYWIFNVPTSRGLSWAVNNSTVLNAVAAGVTIPGTLGVGSDVTLSGSGPILAGGTAAGSWRARNSDGSAQIQFYGPSHATLASKLVLSADGGVSVTGTLGVTGNITTGASGDIRATGGAYLGSSTAVNALIYNGSNGTGTTSMYIGIALITAVSDIRLKDNIVDSTRNAIEIINALRVVEHTWDDPSDQCENNRNSRGVWTGLIAQEAIAHIPWLVNKPTTDVAEDGTPQYWHMDFGYAVPLLMKAIQEISADFQAYKSSHP
jgi:hypothetical protein